jgi:electron transfer flavoprotein beta subunit
MKIVVLLRRLRARPDGATASELLGCCDVAALRAALSLRQATPGAQLTAIAAGAAEREEPVLKRALAAGADRAIRIDDPGLETVDYHGIGRVLAAAARHAGYDLVLAGDRSEDEVQGAVGPAVAELCGVPHLTGVLDVSLSGRALLAVRRDAGAVRTLKVPVPALLTIVSFGNGAAAHQLPENGASAARKIETLDLAALGIQAIELKHRDRCLGRAHPVRVVRNATVVSDPDELLARLRDDRLLG